MCDKTLTDFMGEKYENREDKDNIFGVGITDGKSLSLDLKNIDKKENNNGN